MSRVRTNTVRSYNTDTVTVENPTLSGQITANGVRVYFGNPANGQVIAYDSVANTYKPMTISTDGVGGGVTWLPQLLDVLVATDDSGRTDVPHGSILQFNNNDPNDPSNGFWTATTVHDGGEY